ADRRPVRAELPEHPRAALGLRLLLLARPDRGVDARAIRVLPAQGLAVGSGGGSRPAARPPLASLARCRSTSVPTARTGRSTSTVSRACPARRSPATAAASGSCSS